MFEWSWLHFADRDHEKFNDHVHRQMQRQTEGARKKRLRTTPSTGWVYNTSLEPGFPGSLMLEDNKHMPPSDMWGVNSTVERMLLQARWLQTGRSLWQMRDLTFHLKKHARNHTGSRLASGCQPCGMQHVSPGRETNVKLRTNREEVSGFF